MPACLKTVVLVVLFSTIPAAGYSATWIVSPGESIQEAIDSADPGDTILVRPGTYFENIDFSGKAVDLRSDIDGDSGTNDPDPSVTCIDGNSSGSAVIFTQSEGPDSVLEGFTITNGSGTYFEATSGNWDYCGGGILCDFSSPTVRGNIIENNSVAYRGGGMFNFLSSPILDQCIFRVNQSRYGAGMENRLFSDPVLTDCVFDSNVALYGTTSGYGGGMNNHISSPELTDCSFLNNIAQGTYGGGMYNYKSSPLLTRCTFSNNASDRKGGGMHNYYESDPWLVNCTFTENTSIQGGGLCNHHHCDPILRGCTFVENRANKYILGGGDGGGLHTEAYCSPTIINCAFIANSAEDDGGGIYDYTGTGSTYINCTFRMNEAGDKAGGIYFLVSDSTMTHCILWGNIPDEIQGAAAPVTYSCVEGGHPGEGNIAENPRFADPSNELEFHLAWDSPCINRGSNDLASSEDFDGDLRPAMGTADMGADEFTGTHILAADRFAVSRSLEEEVVFTLDGGAEHAGWWYLVLGSQSGTVPGYPLPSGAVLPLNWDYLTSFVLGRLNSSRFSNFLGVLDAAGRGTAKLHLMPDDIPAGWIGGAMHYAFLLDSPFEFVSNPVVVAVDP